MKKILLSLTCVLLVFSLTACNQKKQEQSKTADTNATTSKPVQELTFNLSGEPKSIDPQLVIGIPGGIVTNNTFEGLTRKGKNGKVIFAGATSVDVSADKTVYTFHLRKDAKWSDGKSVTASDYRYSWIRGVDPKTGAKHSNQYFYIKGTKAFFEGKAPRDDIGIKALDDYTLQVTLVAPTPYFLSLTATDIFMPVRKDVVEKKPDTWATNPNIVVSNGPFVLSSYKLNSNIVLKPNPYYWDKANVKLKKVTFVMIVNDETALVAYDNNEVNIVTELPLQEIAKRKIEDPTYHVFPKVGTYYYDLNMQKPPLNNINVRKALTLAINKKLLVEKVAKGGQTIATGFVPVGPNDSTGKSFRHTAGAYGIPIQGNIKEAQEDLAKAGYPGGKGFPVMEVLYNTNKGHKAIAEAIQAMWKTNLGINVTLKNQEWAVFLNTRIHHNFQITRDGWIGDYNDAMTMLDLFTSFSPYNYFQWDSPKYDALIHKAKTTEGTTRDKAMYDAEKLLEAQYITIPIYYYNQPSLVKANIKGWSCDNFAIWYLGNAYISDK